MTFAYWRRCDFQVHTPRDPNWTGAAPIGQGEPVPDSGQPATQNEVASGRQEWARGFVSACVTKGLEAVALTDHHEMIMVPYVQAEIALRKQSDPEFDLWLFPGMELTASGGKQCLILFDSDLSVEWWRQAMGRLGIAYAGSDELAAKGPKVTQLRCSYGEIGAELDDVPGLKGRYIVLPNVSQGGRFSVLVDGGHAEFKAMPYVGGYLDRGQSINTLAARNKQRLSGGDSTWSTRSIYPLPTSDNRNADYQALGENNAWIKLAAPTAEAIRQAFLGCRSRICIESPTVPSLAVSGIEYSGSLILKSHGLTLSSEFNAIIGGRGSGKSSLLEYIAFGLGRSCYDVKRDQYSGTDRMKSVIVDTIIAKNASITLTIRQDRATFKISRGPGTAYQPKITYPNGTEQTVTTKELRALFPAVVYSQGELAEIGKQTGKQAELTDLLQFVNADYKKEDDRLSLAIENARKAVRAAVQTLTDAWSDQARLHKLEVARTSLVQRAEALEKTLPALSGGDQTIVSTFDRANEFETRRMQASKHADQILSNVKAIESELSFERELANDLGGTTEEYQRIYKSFFEIYRTGFARLLKDLTAERTNLTGAEEKWNNEFRISRQARDEVLRKLGDHQNVTGQIIKLREELAHVGNEIGDLRAKLTALGDPARGFAQALEGLKEAAEERAVRTQEWGEAIGHLSNGKIRAAVDVVGDTVELADALELLAAKTGSQEATRIRMLDEFISREDVWVVTERLRSECMSLFHWCKIGIASGEPQPSMPNLITVLGDTDRIRTAIAEKLDASRVQAMTCAVPKPSITLTYCDGAREIAFEKASEGQRAAALLFMLLEQPGGPLIIDQPEGDLDNKIISDLTDKLHQAKRNRQLIFASHNANIVVNGSAELVGHLEVEDDGNRHFACAGAIDTPSICGIITSTMEGGPKAFKDRQDKYGY